MAQAWGVLKVMCAIVVLIGEFFTHKKILKQVPLSVKKIPKHTCVYLSYLGVSFTREEIPN